MTEMHQRADGGVIHLVKGDITQWSGDAIVNAANARMLGGGGVDGAIHRAAGPELRLACEAVPEVAPNVRCPTGEARITRAFGALKCEWVIHTVGPIYRDEATSAPLLASTYDAVFRLADSNHVSSIALPAISCGVYGYPLDEAAEIALDAAVDAPESVSSITFILFNESVYTAFADVLAEL